MKFKHYEIDGIIEVIPDIFKDDRGFFFESYHEQKFREIGINDNFVQSNQSFSSKGVLRGLHYQTEPYAQAKLVRVVKGSALDIAVDIRRDSPTFGRYCQCILTETAHNMLYIPGGFAHGFLALEDCIFQYMCSNFYNRSSEGGIRWNDETLAIDWSIVNPIVSEKDLKLQTFKAFTKDYK
ncbi:MAG: dTDP-4-dehydrorhamnose 3,5-epimerase [Cytophagales bacterium]|nr:dTDP-4-dehydrorhamnose 3,5-epimerase [Cytophagales bacterium]